MKSTKLIMAAVCVLLLACAFSGCIGSDDPANNTTNNSTYTPTTVVTVTKEDIVIGANEIIQIILPENPTTGYIWNAPAVDGLIIREVYVPDANPNDMTGVGGTKVFDITAEKEGSYDFKALYKRANDETSLYTFTQKLDYNAPVNDESSSPKLALKFEGEPTPKVGDVVEIRVRGNPTTGYEWTALMSENGMLKLLDSEYAEDEHEDEMAGVGGTYIWYVTSDVAGTYTFDASYGKSWENESINNFYFDLTFVE